MFRVRMGTKIAGALAVSAMMLMLPVMAARASSVPPGAGKLWLVKDNDMAVFGGNASDFTWVACGLGTAGTYGTKTGPCAKRQIPIYASYWALAHAIAIGRVVSGDTVLFDQEPWSWTPLRERQHPFYYLKAAALLAHAHGILIIETPYVRGAAPLIADDVAAARYADVVDIQAQRYVQHPSYFGTFVAQAVAAIRAVSPTVKILAGIAPDAGGTPVTASQMYRSYSLAFPVVDGFWLNAAKWAPPRGQGCAPKGCPGVVNRFLADIVASGIPASRGMILAATEAGDLASQYGNHSDVDAKHIATLTGDGSFRNLAAHAVHQTVRKMCSASRRDATRLLMRRWPAVKLATILQGLSPAALPCT